MPIEENVFLRFSTTADDLGALDDLVENLTTAEKLATTTLKPLIRSQQELNEQLEESTTSSQKRVALQTALNRGKREQAKIQRDIDRIDKQRIRAEERINKLIEERRKIRSRQVRERLDGIVPKKADLDRLEEINSLLENQRDRVKELADESGLLNAGLKEFQGIQDENKKKFIELGGTLEEVLGGSEALINSFLSLSSGRATGREIFGTIAQLAQRFGALGIAVGAIGGTGGFIASRFQSVGNFVQQQSSGLSAGLGALGDLGIGGTFATNPFAAFTEARGARIDLVKAQQDRALALANERQLRESIVSSTIELAKNNQSLEDRKKIITDTADLQEKQLENRLNSAQAELDALDREIEADRKRIGTEDIAIEKLQARAQLRGEIDALQASSLQLGEERRLQLEAEEARAIQIEAIEKRTEARRKISSGRGLDIQNRLIELQERQRLLDNQTGIPQEQRDAEQLEINKGLNEVQRESAILVEDRLQLINELNIRLGQQSKAIQDLEIARRRDNTQITNNNTLLKGLTEGTVEHNRILVENAELRDRVARTTTRIEIEQLREQQMIQEEFLNSSINNEIERNAAILDSRLDTAIRSLEIERDLNAQTESERARFNNEILNLQRQRNQSGFTAQQQRGGQLINNAFISQRGAALTRAAGRRDIFGNLSKRGQADLQETNRIIDAQQKLANALLQVQLISERIAENREGDDVEQLTEDLGEAKNEAKALGQDLEQLREGHSFVGRLFGLDRANEDLRDIDDGLAAAEASMVQFVNNVLAEEVRRADQSIAIQERRVDRAARLLAKGNADAINAEEEKLDALLEKREAAVQRQRTFAALEVAASQAVAQAAILEGLSKAIGQGPPLAFLSVPLMLGLIASLGVAAASIGSAFGDVPGFYDGTDENIAASLGRPHFSGKDGYIVRVDGREKVLNPHYSDMVSHMSQQELVENALRGERFALSDAISVNPMQESRSAKELLQETRELRKTIENMRVNVSLDRNGFNVSQQKRVDRINRIKRIRSK